jgi:DNA-binding PadR family transcriptional regulator
MNSASIGSLSPEFALLGMLSQGPAHGYELHQKLSTELGEVWHLSQSQIYNILNRLEGKGYIRGTLLQQKKLPAKRLFQLTEAGQNRFNSWLYSPSRSSVRAIRIEFTTRLYFALAIDPEMASDLIDGQIAEIQGGLQHLEVRKSSLPDDQTFNRLGLDLRIRQLNSILDWLASCYEILEISSNKDLSI